MESCDGHNIMILAFSHCGADSSPLEQLRCFLLLPGETVDGADPCARLADVGEKVTDTQQTAKARSRGCRRETRLAVKDAVLSKHVFSSLFLLFSGDFTHL